MFAWLTPEIRKAIYGLVTIGMGIALAYGLITTEQIEVSIELIGQVIVLLQSAMAFLNTNIEPK
jgi:hypothetical protein